MKKYTLIGKNMVKEIINNNSGYKIFIMSGFKSIGSKEREAKNMDKLISKKNGPVKDSYKSYNNKDGDFNVSFLRSGRS